MRRPAAVLAIVTALTLRTVFHLGIDGDGYIIASALTDSGEDDASVGISMLEQVNGARSRAPTARLALPESAKIVA